MHPEIMVLIGGAATVAFLHTVLGPDHYLPLVAMARSRGWSLARTVNVTLLCGLGHIAGSVLLGALGIGLGTAVDSLVRIEAARGNLALWLLCGFGLAYTIWGLRQASRKRPHSHWHHHGEVVHAHAHGHRGDHAHVHDAGAAGLAPWIVFVIFVLGPCEPLIPLLMYPAATHSVAGVFMVAGVFGVVTVLTMLTAVVVLHAGLRRFRFEGMQRYGHALAGLTLFSCGAGMALLGL